MEASDSEDSDNITRILFSNNIQIVCQQESFLVDRNISIKSVCVCVCWYVITRPLLVRLVLLENLDRGGERRGEGGLSFRVPPRSLPHNTTFVGEQPIK